MEVPENLKKDGIVSDAFIDSIKTQTSDGTMLVTIAVFPDIETEKKIYALKKTHVKIVMFPQGDEGKRNW